MKKPHNTNRTGGFGKCLLAATLALCFLPSLLASASVTGQATVTARFRNATLNEVLWEIQKQTDFTFIYSTSDAEKVKVESLDVKNEPLSDVLDKCLQNSGLTYKVHNGVIAIRKAEPVTVRTEVAEEKSHRITGKVTDINNEPIIGANVVVKGTKNGMITDLNGGFHLDVADKEVTLVVSYIGFTTREVSVAPGDDVRITLREDTTLLEEVIVTGYGTFKKSAYAGSASIVKTDEVKDVPNVSFQQMLEGAAPGVGVSNASGIPGSSTSIRIRGMGSFNASNSPLYVVDGVPVLSGNIGASGSDSGLDVMSTLNTSDIESITVI